MEVKETSKKRELIKSIAIVFLAVLLVLTFFSNTIMNRSLPEVATQVISSGTINARIRGSGAVSANESYEVILNQTRQVRSVCVGVGDMVQQGDLLFVLEDVESQELKDAQEQLDTLNLQYQQQLLTLSRDYASEDRAVQVLREDLEKAVKQRDENLVTEEEISYAKGDLAAAQDQLEEVGLILSELEAMLSDDEEYTKAQTEVEKLTARMETLQQSVKDYQKQLSQVGSGDVSLDRQKADALEAKNSAQHTLDSLWLAYHASYASLAGEARDYYVSLVERKKEAERRDELTAAEKVEIEEIKAVFETIPGANTGFSITPQQRRYIDAYLTECEANGTSHRFADGYRALIGAAEELAAKTEAYNRVQSDLGAANSELSGERLSIQAELSRVSMELSSIQSYQLPQARAALAQAESRNASLKNQVKSYESSQRQQSAYVEDLKEGLTELEGKKTLYDQAMELVAEKERAIADALTGKSIDRQLDDLSLQSIQMQIDKAQALVDKYTKDSVDTEVRANVGGLITAIGVSAGKETVSGAAMATIDVVDRGYTLKIPVTNEQARQVKVGDTADVTNYYWGGELEAVLESVAANPDSPGTGKLLIFRITGEIDAGTNITLSIGQRSASYDTIIPKSALRQDTNGHFVLVITVKSSPLSNRYIATRVDVDVLAEDDTSAAVSGLSAGDFVVTTTSRPVDAGSQVRMVENP